MFNDHSKDRVHSHYIRTDHTCNLLIRKVRYRTFLFAYKTVFIYYLTTGFKSSKNFFTISH